MTDRIKIRQETMEVNLDAITFYDGQFFIAFIPSLNIVSHNKDEKLAKSQLDDAVELFFDYWTESGKIHEKLLDLGWEPKMLIFITLMALFEFNIKQVIDTSGIEKKLDIIIKQNTNMAKNFTDLEAQIDTLTGKVDTLQATVDTEQEQIQAAIDALATANAEQTTLIQQLRDELAGLGADQVKIDELVGKAEAVNTKLDTIKTDLEGTIAEG